ncbi:MAG: UDP-N-acetylglucosamine--N-acetylmuramyl-(pentapeptide) pyrophosphoryl-undecaprenol N-acetylglucosamine transferase [Pseudomonadaceae bacterium]|nr:UDP-N-acetylglucosamine--N-acetylmuramyl-(pentapeptide) pyrophosphoryl-undecaprenol N-acetylglucosamine transferase [Pseudomonadaceae bacterium]
MSANPQSGSDVSSSSTSSSSRDKATQQGTLLFAGGGTAGHIIPALPVVEKCIARGYDATFVVGTAELERELVSGAGATPYVLRTGKLRRYLSWQNLTDVFRTITAVFRSIALIRRIRPKAVMSKGGYVALPVVVAAWLCRVPVLAHESDASSGLANRLSAPFVSTLCTSFPQTTVPRFRGRLVHTGTPVRDELLAGDAERGRSMLGLTSSERPLIVVTGGSLGADAINALVRKAAPVLCQRYDIFHVCGSGKTEELNVDGYANAEFVGAGWGDILAAADIVVSRAGANALFELIALRKLMLLIPLPAKSSRGDQIENAAYAADHGLAVSVEEEQLDGDVLIREIDTLWANAQSIHGRLALTAYPDAGQALTDELLLLAESR